MRAFTVFVVAVFVLAQACAHAPVTQSIATPDQDNWSVTFTGFDQRNKSFWVDVKPLRSLAVSGQGLEGQVRFTGRELEIVRRYLGVKEVQWNTAHTFNVVHTEALMAEAQGNMQTFYLVAQLLIAKARLAMVIALAVTNHQDLPLSDEDRLVLVQSIQDPGFVRGIQNMAAGWESEITILGPGSEAPTPESEDLYLTVEYPRIGIMEVKVSGRP